MIEHGALERIGLESAAVLLECLQPQFIKPAPEPLADLVADLAEPCPT
jgi:hypothetical protein